MTFDAKSERQKDLTLTVVDIAVKLAMLAVLSYGVLLFVGPFVGILVWGAIIAVSAYPAFTWCRRKFGGKENLIAALFGVFSVALLAVPVAFVVVSSIEGLRRIAHRLSTGTLDIPPPPQTLKDGPLVGHRLYELWSLASTNLSEFLHDNEARIEAAAEWLLDQAGALAVGVGTFLASLVVAAILLAKADGFRRGIVRFAARLLGTEGAGLVSLCGKTVRSVAVGVIGIAAIQAGLSWLGFVVVGVPLPGVWALAVLVVATIQVPPILVIGPIIVYVLATGDTTTGILFAIYGIAVGLSDNVLKPLLLGRGVDIPMLVILVGAIGGAISAGVVGLFIGAVVLALAYQLAKAWLGQFDEPQKPTPDTRDLEQRPTQPADVVGSLPLVSKPAHGRG